MKSEDSMAWSQDWSVFQILSQFKPIHILSLYFKITFNIIIQPR